MKAGSVALLALAAACSALPTQGDGIVALQVDVPTAGIVLVQGQSITLHARALDLQGDSVAATIVWATPDTALIALDSNTGTVTALTGSGVARVQASIGTLRSELVSIGLQPDTTASDLRLPR